MQKEPVVIRAPSFLYSYNFIPPTASIPSALLQDLRSYPLNLSTGMSGTILQAEIDSNHQFVREKVVSHGQVAQNQQLVREKVGFYGQVARRESVA